MFRIYTKEQKSKEVFNVNLDASELQSVMGGNIFLDHPELNKDDYIIVEQENSFICPIYNAEKNIIEEATREQRILLFQETDLLQDGEYVDRETVITEFLVMKTSLEKHGIKSFMFGKRERQMICKHLHIQKKKELIGHLMMMIL